MRGVRLVQTLRNNPRYLCKYLVWTNILVLLYFVISVNPGQDSPSTTKLVEPEEELSSVRSESSEEQKKYKFEDFDLQRWKKIQHFTLEDSDGQFFT